MSYEGNRDYYLSRIQAERLLAQESQTAAVAALHNEMANRYAALLADLDDSARPVPLSSASG